MGDAENNGGATTGVRWWFQYVIVPLVGAGGVTGIILAIVSMYHSSPNPVNSSSLNQAPAPVQPTPAPQPAPAVTIRLALRCDPPPPPKNEAGQLLELTEFWKRATVRFPGNGETVSLKCDIATGPNDDVEKATFTATGPEQYSIEGYESLQYLTIQPISFPATGSGTLDVENRSRFVIAIGQTPLSHTMFLQPE
jgi:hypothetical protein